MQEDPKPWKVLRSEYLFRRPWLTARKDCVQLPSGVINEEYYVLEYPTWIKVIALTPEGKMVMIRQYRHGLGRTCYELVAGVMDPTDATPEEAARRELMEETGYGGGCWLPFTVLSPNASACNNVSHCFLALGVTPQGDRHLEPTEDITVHLLSEDEVHRLLVNDEIKQALMAAPLWKYFALRAAGQDPAQGAL